MIIKHKLPEQFINLCTTSINDSVSALKINKVVGKWKNPQIPLHKMNKRLIHGG